MVKINWFRIDPDDEDDELAEFEKLQRKNRDDLTIIERGKLFIEEIVQKVGFLGILACASVSISFFFIIKCVCMLYSVFEKSRDTKIILLILN